MIQEEELHSFVGKVLNDLGPTTAKKLAAHTDLSERYLREWLSHQASGYRDVVINGGGFARFRRAAETPFNMILEARP